MSSNGSYATVNKWTPASGGTLSTLPPELFDLILAHLDPPEIHLMKGVNRFWKARAEHLLGLDPIRKRNCLIPEPFTGDPTTQEFCYDDLHPILRGFREVGLGFCVRGNMLSTGWNDRHFVTYPPGPTRNSWVRVRNIVHFLASLEKQLQVCSSHQFIQPSCHKIFVAGIETDATDIGVVVGLLIQVCFEALATRDGLVLRKAVEEYQRGNGRADWKMAGRGVLREVLQVYRTLWPLLEPRMRAQVWYEDLGRDLTRDLVRWGR